MWTICYHSSHHILSSSSNHYGIQHQQHLRQLSQPQPPCCSNTPTAYTAYLLLYIIQYTAMTTKQYEEISRYLINLMHASAHAPVHIHTNTPQTPPLHTDTDTDTDTDTHHTRIVNSCDLESFDTPAYCNQIDMPYSFVKMPLLGGSNKYPNSLDIQIWIT